MKTLLKGFINVFKAPKSTIVALCLLACLTWLQHAKIIEKEVYSVAVGLVVPLIFTDLMKESKKEEQV